MLPARSATGTRRAVTDGHDRRLGGPRHARVVASSERRSKTVNEAVLVAQGLADAARPAGVRADTLFLETPKDGAALSTGAIAQAG